MMTVMITGVNGFVGSRLAADLSGRGCRVIGSTSNETGLRVTTPGVERKVVLPLGGSWDPTLVQGVDTVLHCGWDLRPHAVDDNVAGTKGLAEVSEAAGVKHQVFLSTNSAHASAVSGYGKGKFTAQEYMLTRGHAVARLGLVIGPGGVFRRLSETVTRYPVVPLVDGGRNMVPIISAFDLVAALGTIIEQRLTGLYSLFNPEPVSLKDVVLEVRTAARRRTLLVPVPSSALLTPVALAAKLGIKLPVNVDNLQGLRANLNVRERSDLLTFVPRPLTLAEMVRAALNAGATR